MKAKTLFTIILVMFGLSIWAQNYETVVEIETENMVAERIESALKPVVGKTIVMVDLTLQYPSNGLVPFGMELDRKASLPGLPIAKSKGVLTPNTAGKPTFPTMVLAKKITVYTSNKIPANLEKWIRDNITKWYSMDITKGDILDLRKELNVVEEKIESSFFEKPLGIFVLALIAVLIMFIMFYIHYKRIAGHIEHMGHCLYQQTHGDTEGKIDNKK